MHKGQSAIGCKKYITEAIRRIEAITKPPIKRQSTPLPTGDHPELDTSKFLDNKGHRCCQMLIGMLNWIVGIGQFDIAYATTSLTRFSSCPRKCHLDRALWVFGYLKKHPPKRILVDSRDPIITGGDEVKAKQLATSFCEECPDAVEEINCNLPMPLVGGLAITTLSILTMLMTR